MVGLAIRKVYAAGPINGRTDEECIPWRKQLTADLAPLGIKVLDPMDFDYRGHEGDHAAEIVERDKAAIDESDAIVVRFDRPSVGTSMEELYAWERNRLVVLWVTEDAPRPVSPWLLHHAHIVVHSPESLVQVFSMLRAGRAKEAAA